MNTKSTAWFHRYQMALRKHLMQESEVIPPSALRLGRQAVTLGLEPLDLALIHKKALMSLLSPGGAIKTNLKKIKQANIYFARTIVPIEKTHSAALKANFRVDQLTKTLRRRTVESSASTRRLERGIARRQVSETALKKSGEHHIRLLKESGRLQNRLKLQTRKVLSAQENQRRENSLLLQNKVAQTLLAIKLRLVTLKKSTRANTQDTRQEIADTQRLVRQSRNLTHRLAHAFDKNHET